MGINFNARTALGVGIGTALAVLILQSMIAWWIGRTSSTVGHRLVADIRVEIFEHLLRMPVRYVERRGTGRVLLRFIGDSDALRLWISRLGPMAAADQFIVLILVAVMLAIDVQLAVLVSIPILLTAVVCYFFRDSLRQATQSSRNLQASFTGSVEERLSQLRQFKWLTAGKYKDGSVYELSQRIAGNNSYRDSIGSFLEAIASLIASIAVLLVLWVGINRVWSGSLSTGQLVAFIWIGFQLSETLKRLAAAAVASQKSWVSSTRILHLLSRSSELGRGEKYLRRRWRCDALEISQKSGGVALAKYNGPGIYDLPPTIEPEMFIDELLGFQKSRHLDVRIDHRSVDAFNIHQIREVIGWITVRGAIFKGTFKENLIFHHLGDAESLSAPPLWAKHCFSTSLRGAIGLKTTPSRFGSNQGEKDLALLALVRSTLRGARMFIVDAHTYKLLPPAVWEELATKSMVLLGSSNSKCERHRTKSIQLVSD